MTTETLSPAKREVLRTCSSAESLPTYGRVTVERMIEAWHPGIDSDDCKMAAGYYRKRVEFIAERGDAETRIRIEVGKETLLRLDLDTLVEITAALCPSWLLRKKLGL